MRNEKRCGTGEVLEEPQLATPDNQGEMVAVCTPLCM